MTTLRAGIALGAVVMLGLLVVVLSDSDQRLAGTNAQVRVSGVDLRIVPHQRRCQEQDVPAEATTVRVFAKPLVLSGGPLDVTLSKDGRTLAEGVVYHAGRDVPAVGRLDRPLKREVTGVSVCIVNGGPWPIELRGDRTPPLHSSLSGFVGDDQPPDDVRVDFLRGGSESWWALAPVVAKRFFLEKAAFFGPWTMWAVFVLIGLNWVAALFVLTRRWPPGLRPPARAFRRRLATIPRAALLCAAITVVNCVCWAAITPALWVPDEVSHLGYAQHIAETGRLPSDPRSATPDVGPGPSDEQSILSGTMPFSVEGRPSWSPTRAREQRSILNAGDLSRTRAGQGLAAGVHPPLYYLAEAVPYRLASGSSLLNRLMAMRLLSALFAGTTVFFIFLFLRELLPGTPWAWVVGALTLAFQPMLGFLGGGVNNDNLALAASAALFYGVARAFHRGLRPGTGVIIGVAVAVGALTKVSVAGLLPGVAVGLAALLWRAAPATRRQAFLGAGAALATAAVPWMAWLAYSKAKLAGAPAPAAGLASSSVTGGSSALRGQLSYVWQAFLPRLPFMGQKIPWYPPWETFFKGFIGRFGWFEYGFRKVWYFVALGLFVPIVGLAGLALARTRRALRSRGIELATYVVMAVGLALALEVVAYRYHAMVNSQAFFEQARYLFPLLPLYGALVAAAVKGAGQRFGPAVGGFIVVLAMGHSLFSQLLTIARFYA